jgi:hypothetical protein
MNYFKKNLNYIKIATFISVPIILSQYTSLGIISGYIIGSVTTFAFLLVV